MEHHPLQSLINLIEFDRELIKIERVLDETQKRITQLQNEEAKIKVDHETAIQHVRDAKKIVHEHEVTMKDLDLREQAKKKLLEETDSQKVYETLKKEINFLKKSQYDHEKKLVQCWKELEAAQKTFDEQESKFKEKQESLQKKYAEEDATVQKLTADLNDLYKERVKKEKLVPQEWIQKYNMMRKQTDNPIVRVEYDSCSGCFAQLPPQSILDLKQKKLLQCNSCYRFIYLPEELEEEPITQKNE